MKKKITKRGKIEKLWILVSLLNFLSHTQKQKTCEITTCRKLRRDQVYELHFRHCIREHTTCGRMARKPLRLSLARELLMKKLFFFSFAWRRNLLISCLYAADSCAMKCISLIVINMPMNQWGDLLWHWEEIFLFSVFIELEIFEKS